MVQVSSRAPTEADILELLANLAKEDRDELLIQGVEPEWAIRHSIKISEECVAIFGDGTLACITGVNVAEGLSPEASPWLLGTEFMQRYPRHVLRYSKMLLSRWQARYPFMFNFVDIRHKRAIMWLEHLGANKELVPDHGPYKKPFYRFTFGVDPCALQQPAE